MRVWGWQGAPIDVVRLPNGTLVSVDNTRVLAAHRAGIEIRAVVHKAGDALPSGFAQRFTPRSGIAPQTWGEAVLNRINSQNRLFRETYPEGAPVTGSSQ
jgi:hypothetical protein